VRAAVEAVEEAGTLKGVRLDATLPDESVAMWGDAHACTRWSATSSPTP